MRPGRIAAILAVVSFLLSSCVSAMVPSLPMMPPPTATSAATSLSLPPVPTLPPAGTIAFIGDSLTVGLFASDVQHGYAALVAAQLGKSWHAVGYDKAYSTTEQAVARGVIHWARAQHARVFVVELGTNDAGEGHVPLATFRATYDHLLASLRAMGHPRLYCLTTWSEADGVEYDGAIDYVCEKHDGAVVDISDVPGPGMSGPAGRMTAFGRADGWHPNNAGHAAIADAVLQAMGIAQDQP